MKNIILIGFMGAGKTKVGKLLAKTLGYGFVDMDELIEEKEGLPIKEIFEKRGEKYFREKEKEWLKRLSLLEKIVLSPGGGIILSSENRGRLRRMGKVFYLKASPETILERVKNESHRPLLEGGRKEKKVKEILKLRERLYEKTAHFSVDTTHFTVEEVKERILKELEK